MTEVRDSINDIDFGSFVRSIGVRLPRGGLRASSPFRKLLDWVTALGSVGGELDDRWDLDAPLTEDKIIRWLGYGAPSNEAGPDILAAALTLLALVAARLWRPELALVEPDDWFPVIEGGNERLSMQRFLAGMMPQLMPSRSLGSTPRPSLDFGAEGLSRLYVRYRPVDGLQRRWSGSLPQELRKG